MKLENPFESQGNWYKANLHTHSTTSDGEATPAERIAQYRKGKYNVLALTDHGLTNNLEGLSTDDLLVISGMEAHPQCTLDDSKHHLVCLNVPQGLSFEEETPAQEIIDEVRRAGGEVVFCHPYWTGYNINHLQSINGYIAVEVYNATCSKIGKGFGSVQWDDFLAEVGPLGAIAVDDTHRGRDMFMGWTWIKAKQLSVDAIMESLRLGRYYSSCGPVIEDFHIEDGKAMLTCSPVREIHFLSRRAAGLSFYADGAGPLTNAEREVGESLKYVRAEIVDADGKRAWTNPIFL